MKPTLNPALHELAYCLRFIGIRSRLRCPKCRAVGTWKPHGGIIDGIWDHAHGQYDTRLTRRWLCKWCGHYVGPEGTMKAYVDLNKKVWTLPGRIDSNFTPADTVKEHMGDVWPWRG